MNTKVIIAVAAVALVAAGAGVYFFENPSSSSDESDSYYASSLSPVKDDTDPKISYLDDVSTSSPEFAQLLKDDDYIDKAKEIKKEGQQSLDDLSERTNGRIQEILKKIDQYSYASGTDQNGVIWDINDFEIMHTTSYDTLESYPSFLVRYILHCESRDIDGVYKYMNDIYVANLPQEFKDIYSEYNIANDYERDYQICEYLSTVEHHWDERNPVTGEWERIVELEFSEDIPEGTTMEFLQDLHPVYMECYNEVYDAHDSVRNQKIPEDYPKEYFDMLGTKGHERSIYDLWVQLTTDVSNSHEIMDEHLESIPAQYADSICACMDEIFDIRDNYPEEVQKLKDDIQRQMAELQREKLSQL